MISATVITAPKIRRRLKVADDQVRTKAAAETAIKTCEQVAGSGGPNKDLDEQTLFRALHTCAYWAGIWGRRRSVTPAEREKWAERWRLICDYIVEQNLGLAYSIVRRFQGAGLDWDELRSEAFYALVRAARGFDPWRGFRFSTYATNAITRALYQVSKKAAKYRLRFPIEDDDIPSEPPAREDGWAEVYADRLNRALTLNLGELTDREATVLEWRFPSDGGFARTLSEVGDAMGLSKERVRQIQRTALDKLREVLEADPALQ